MSTNNDKRKEEKTLIDVTYDEVKDIKGVLVLFEGDLTLFKLASMWQLFHINGGVHSSDPDECDINSTDMWDFYYFDYTAYLKLCGIPTSRWNKDKIDLLINAKVIFPDGRLQEQVKKLIDVKIDPSNEEVEGDFDYEEEF